MSIKDKIMNITLGHPKAVTFGIGLAITFAIGLAIGMLGPWSDGICRCGRKD